MLGISQTEQNSGLLILSVRGSNDFDQIPGPEYGRTSIVFRFWLGLTPQGVLLLQYCGGDHDLWHTDLVQLLVAITSSMGAGRMALALTHLWQVIFQQTNHAREPLKNSPSSCLCG